MLQWAAWTLGCFLALPWPAGCGGARSARPDANEGTLAEGCETFDGTISDGGGARDDRPLDTVPDAPARRDGAADCWLASDARMDVLVDASDAPEVAADARPETAQDIRADLAISDAPTSRDVAIDWCPFADARMEAGVGAPDAADALADAGPETTPDVRTDSVADAEPVDARRAGDAMRDQVEDARRDTQDARHVDGREWDNRNADVPAVCEGPCCRDGELLGTEATCAPEAELQYGCPQGTDCGSVVAFRARGRLCSGRSPACEGELGPWGEWQPVATCDATASCVEGEPACVSSTACPCPEEMVHVPAGSFVMGALPGEGNYHEIPAHDVMHPAYCIDRYEVTVEKFAHFMNTVAIDASGRTNDDCTIAGMPALCQEVDDRVPIQSSTDGTYYEIMSFCQAAPGAPATTSCASHPITYVDWHASQNYCLWRGWRLPSEAEWERAARSTDQRRYPWGNDAAPRTAGECFENASETQACADGYAQTAPVGSFEQDRSPSGCYDMMGNVREYVADDWHEDYVGAPSDGSAWLDYEGRPPVGGDVVGRGGGYLSPQGPIWSRGRGMRTGGSGWIGFRCAR